MAQQTSSNPGAGVTAGLTFVESNMKREANEDGTVLIEGDNRVPHKPRRAKLEAELSKRKIAFEPNTPVDVLMTMMDDEAPKRRGRKPRGR